MYLHRLGRGEVVRAQVEGALARRAPRALSPRSFPVRPTLACGLHDIDSLLEGGLPFGAVSEMSGAACSGRTTLALRFVAAIIRQTHVCAWIDATDAFDPESARANSIDLDRLLWVRCGVKPAAVQDHPGQVGTIPSQTCGQAVIAGSNSLHPRSEAKGLGEAVGRFFGAQTAWQAKPGTPGAQNVPLPPKLPTSSQGYVQRGIQTSTDRLPARRGGYLLELQRAELQSANRPAICDLAEPMVQRSTLKPVKSATPWGRLDQALRVTDLLMQSGGFGAVVLDLGGIAPQAASRIPLATWFRMRAAADRTRTCFLLLSQYACAQSSAEVSLRVSLERSGKGTVMTSLPIRVEVRRQRFRTGNVTSIRKGPQSASVAGWSPPTAWAATR